MTGAISGNQQRAGRFYFTVPETMSLDGRSQIIYGTNVSTTPIPPGGALGHWDRHLEEIRGRGIEPAAMRTFELQPGTSAVWYAEHESPNILTLETMTPKSDHLLLLDREAYAGKEAGAETLVRNIVNTYVQRAAYGFCVGYGSIAMEPSQTESARITFSRRNVPEFEIEFSTQTVREPDNQTYSDLDEEREIADAGGGQLTVLKEGVRRVAGLDGKQIWISLTVPGEPPTVRFTWHFAGEPGDSFHPMINILAMAPAAQRADLESAWETVLQSLRQVPLRSETR